MNNEKKFIKLTPFKMQVLQTFPFIDADFDAITNYELLCKVVEYLNITVDNVNLLESDFKVLYDYVHNYFDNLDVQVEINNKLDEMAKSGELTDIIAQYLGLAGMITFNNVSEMKSGQNLVNGSKCCTLGYHTANDGGNALYKIRTILNSDVVNESSLIALHDQTLVAELIVGENINVKQFGAYGDDTHNDTTPIQNAIDYAKDNTQKTVFIPNGTYLCNIIVYPDIEIIGEINSTLKSVEESNADVIKSYDFDEMTGTTGAIPVNKGLYNFKLSNITIDGNLSNNTNGYGIKLFGRNLRFNNINVKNCCDGGIYTEFGTHNPPTTNDASFKSDLLESVFEKIKVFNCLGDGWTYKGPHDSHIKYYICVKCAGWALNADNSTSNGLIIENLNSWWCNNGVVLESGRLSNCQIDGGSYDGTGSANDSIGLKIKDTGGTCFISNCSIGTWGFGAVLGGTGHIINGLNVRNAINTNIHLTNFSQSVLTFKLSTNKTSTNLFKFDGNGANIIQGWINASAGNTLFAGNNPLMQGLNSFNIGSSSNDYVVYQIPTKTIHAQGWAPQLPSSNNSLLANNTAPTASTRGGVLQQTIANFPSGQTATTDQLNSLIASLRSAGVISQL